MASGYDVGSASHAYLSPEEREARRTVVRQLLSLGVSVDALPGALRDQGWPVSRAIARAEYEAVLREWNEDHAAFRDLTRAAQVRRLEADLARYRAAEGLEAGSRGAKTRWQAVVQTEALLARILGHAEPTRVEVKVEAAVVVREALVEVVASLSAEELDAIALEEADRDRLLAEASRDRRALVVRGDPLPDGA